MTSEASLLSTYQKGREGTEQTRRTVGGSGQGHIYIYIKPLKSEAIHETGLSGNVVTSFFPLIIFIYIYIYNLHNGEWASVFNALFKTRRVSAFAFLRGLNVTES